MKWKWRNVPIPVQHLLGLIFGAILQAMFPRPLFANPQFGDILGAFLMAVGLGIVIWSVISVGDLNIESPQRLVVWGPYARSRNPMMMAWTILYIGIAFIINSAWIVALLLLVVLFTHFMDIPIEERKLTKQFGYEYLDYQRRVRRYI